MAAGKRGGIVESGQAGYRDLLACCENSGGLHFFRSQRSEPPQIDLRTPLRGGWARRIRGAACAQLSRRTASGQLVRQIARETLRAGPRSSF